MTLQKKIVVIKLLSRLVVYDVMTKSLILSSQEVKRITTYQAVAENLKIDNIAIPDEERRTNSNNKCCLYVNNEVRSRARIVHNTKIKKWKLTR